eukprot:EG_transcript_3954
MAPVEAPHASYFQLMRTQCTEHRRTVSLRVERPSLAGPPPGAYVHDPYSFGGPKWILAPAAPPAQTEAPDTLAGKRPNNPVSMVLPPDHRALHRLAELWAQRTPPATRRPDAASE